MGKGDSYRPVDRKKYDENFDRIFRGDKQNDQAPVQQTPVREAQPVFAASSSEARNEAALRGQGSGGSSTPS